MDLAGKSVALYGRMVDQPRVALEKAILGASGRVERDLTRKSNFLVIGGGARNLIPSGRLLQRIWSAESQGIPVASERRFWRLINDKEEPRPTYPLINVTSQLAEGAIEILNAFDVVHVAGGNCRFADVDEIRTARSLADEGHSLSAIVVILLDAKDSAPAGRHKVITDAVGEARLQWDDGQTTLGGQGWLPLDESADLDDLFDLAMLAEASGQWADAERYYSMCAQMDRKDSIAPFNLANVLRKLGKDGEAIHRLGQAIARAPEFVEAYYNRALCHEARGDDPLAESDLRAALSFDASYPDAIFNLGQLRLKLGDHHEARELFNRFLSQSPSHEWTVRVKKALSVATLANQNG